MPIIIGLFEPKRTNANDGERRSGAPGRIIDNSVVSIPYAKVRANTARLNGKENIRSLPHHRPCARGAVQGARRAECDGAVVNYVCKLQKAPRVTESDMVIVQDTVGMVDELRGRAPISAGHGGTNGLRFSKAGKGAVPTHPSSYSSVRWQFRWQSRGGVGRLLRF